MRRSSQFRIKLKNYDAFLNTQHFAENVKGLGQQEQFIINARIETLEETQRALQLIKDELGEIEKYKSSVPPFKEAFKFQIENSYVFLLR